MQGHTARVKYRKDGLIRLIGHLDTARAILRAIRRAGIEAVYSQGFSPRIRLSFGPPLPLGCTSECEYFDIKLARKCEPETIKQSLQEHLPEGLSVEQVQILEGNPPPISAAFWAAEYEVELPDDRPLGRETPEPPRSNERPFAGGSNDAPAAGGPVLRASWHESNGGKRLLSLVLRQDASGGVRLKEVITGLLGVSPEEFQRLRIHKKKAYSQDEQP